MAGLDKTCFLFVYRKKEGFFKFSLENLENHSFWMLKKNLAYTCYVKKLYYNDIQ